MFSWACLATMLAILYTIAHWQVSSLDGRAIRHSYLAYAFSIDSSPSRLLSCSPVRSGHCRSHSYAKPIQENESKAEPNLGAFDQSSIP